METVQVKLPLWYVEGGIDLDNYGSEVLPLFRSAVEAAAYFGDDAGEILSVGSVEELLTLAAHAKNIGAEQLTIDPTAGRIIRAERCMNFDDLRAVNGRAVDDDEQGIE